jgi:hypothetical protein
MPGLGLKQKLALTIMVMATAGMSLLPYPLAKARGNYNF